MHSPQSGSKQINDHYRRKRIMENPYLINILNVLINKLLYTESNSIHTLIDDSQIINCICKKSDSSLLIDT